MAEVLKKLPVAAQNFAVIRQEDMLYIDKTDLVWQLANAAEEVVFYARPRRFGKSLLVSTLEAYFQGRRELFEGLKVMELEKEWKRHEVLRFDLSGCLTAESLNEKLDGQLEDYEKKYGIENKYVYPGVRLSNLIKKAADGKRQVVCLFDEYDYPLQHTLFYQEDEHEELKKIYREFFAVLKSESEFIRFIFLTGITKFTQLSLFSVLNNIRTVSLWPKYDTLTGVTEDELRGVLRPYVEELAAANGVDFEGALDAIKQMYDGYHFSRNLIDVYNPYSVLNALNQKELNAFWSDSGNTKMLMDAVDEMGWDGESFDDVFADKQDLESSDVDRHKLSLFLHQAGYLTIKEAGDEYYILGVPNKETRTAIYKCIVPRLVEKRENVVDSAILGMKKSLIMKDVPKAFEYFRELVADTPYSNEKSAKAIEDRFQFIVKQSFYLCNCRILEEKHVALGRIDLVLEHKNAIMVVELKMTANGGVSAACEQIEDRDYSAAFAMKSKPLYTVAIDFDSQSRKMGKVEVRALNTEH